MEKELKRLTRSELVDVIYQMKKNEQRLGEEIASLQKEIQDKRIRISEAGSIAQAASDVTQLLSAAQTTADLYLQEIACMKEETEKECKKKVAETENIVKKLISDGEQQLKTLRTHYQRDYKKWQRLQLNLQELEKKTSALSEGIKHGKKG